MQHSDDPIALLSRALTALWLETVATQPSGALALLEPRIAKEGPRCMTDGEVLWVDAWAMQEWLREPTSEKGRNALGAAGLELLYFWRQKTGPWIVPSTACDTVITAPEHPLRGDWILGVQRPDSPKERDLEVPDPPWKAGAWWKKQDPGLWTGALSSNQSVQLPDYWERTFRPCSLTPTQAQTIWRECVRDLRTQQGPADTEVEKQWLDDCLACHPDELNAWMLMDPPVPVSRNALFHLKDPQWVEAFLQRGAQADAFLAGRSALHHAGQTTPHMVKPLWEAGLTPQGVPLAELLVMIIIGSHHSDEAVSQAAEAAQFLAEKLKKTGTPFDWRENTDLLFPILPRCLLKEERRIEILARIWPDGLSLQDLVPTLQIRNSNGRDETWPLPLTLGALAAEGLTRNTITPDLLESRLITLQRLGVRFSESYPEGGVYHAAMLHSHEADVAREIQRVFNQVGADWNAEDSRGYCARTQKIWKKGILRERQHGQIPWDELAAIDLKGKMEESWDNVGESRAAQRGRL